MAQKRSDTVQSYVTTYPGSPLVTPANTYIDYLKHAIDALAEKGTWQNAFGDMLSNPLVKDIAYVDTTDGRRYYVLGEIKLEEHRLNDQVMTTFSALDPKDPSKRITIHLDPPVKLLNPQPHPLLHTKFAAVMAENIKLIDESNWETFGIDIVEQVIKSQ